MAKQTGIIKLKGTIDDIAFYKSKDGHLARAKGGIEADRIKNDPAFQRTRENNSEFARAGAAGKLLRDAMRAYLQNVSDSRMASRLTKEMMKVIKADATSTRGLRNVVDGEAELLQGFEFNLNAKLGSTFYAPFTTTVDRATGTLKADIPSFVPGNMIASAAGATHFKLVSQGAEIDFEANTIVVANSESGILPIGMAPTAVISLSNVVTVNTTKPLFLALGILFYQEVNGSNYSLKNGAFNALKLVKVDGGV